MGWCEASVDHCERWSVVMSGDSDHRSCDIVGVLWKVPHIVTSTEYADMLYVYAFCDGSATAAVEEYWQRFSMHKIRAHRVFYKVFNTLCERGKLPSAHVSSEWARQQHVQQQDNILDLVQRSPTTSTLRYSACLSVSRTRVTENLAWSWLVPISPTACAKSILRGQCHASRILLLVTY
jgi:hypothetical protein